MANEYQSFREKASTSWLGAQSEHAAGRYDNAAALAYYACFQIGLALHTRTGFSDTRATHGQIWELVNSYTLGRARADLHGTIEDIYAARVVGQYRKYSVSDVLCRRTMDTTRDLMNFLLEVLDSGQL